MGGAASVLSQPSPSQMGALSWDVPALGALQRPHNVWESISLIQGTASPLAVAEEHLQTREHTRNESKVGEHMGNVPKTLPHMTKVPQA